MTVTNSDASSSLQSVDRALQVLELLAGWGTGGVSELAGEIGVHKSTAFRLLGALEAREMVQQDAERGKYRLGFGLVRLARRVNVQLELTEQARPLTDELARTARRVDQRRGAARALRRQRRPVARSGVGGQPELDRSADPAARHLQRQGVAGPPRPRPTGPAARHGSSIGSPPKPTTTPRS